jgi:hypothetical protein
MSMRRHLRGWLGQVLAAVAVSGVLALVLAVSLVQGGRTADPASAVQPTRSVPVACATPPSPPVEAPLCSPASAPTATATATATAAAQPSPSPTDVPITPPAAAAAGGGSAQLSFGGAISGPMEVTSVSCEANQGQSGFAGVIGTVAGRLHMIQLWSRGPSPGTLLYIQVWNGTPATGSDIAYQNNSGMTGSFVGASGFDWTGGVTLDAALTDFKVATNPGIHLSGRITCPTPTPTPTPAPQSWPEPLLSGPTHVVLSGAISGVLENAGVSCQVHVPEGDGGAMSVSGTVAGRPVQLWIWSKGPSPGTLGDMYEGPQAGAIDYGQIGADGRAPDLSGITGFDWQRGATFDIAMPDVRWVGKQSAPPSPAPPGIRVSGQIVC